MTEILFYDFFALPEGMLAIAASKKGLRSIHYGISTSELKDKLAENANVTYVLASGEIAPIKEQIRAYLEGYQQQFEVKLDIAQGTELQREVWNQLLQIPYGKTISYSEMAERVGKPDAVRAIGSACGANPIPLIIPCHRVLAKDGSLGGFGWGLPMKHYLLELERSHSENRKAA